MNSPAFSSTEAKAKTFAININKLSGSYDNGIKEANTVSPRTNIIMTNYGDELEVEGTGEID